MNARRAARQLALLTLFQLDRPALKPQAGVADETEAASPADVSEPDIHAMMLASVRALSEEARTKIRTAADSLAEVSRSFLSYEAEHPDNLATPIEAEALPVPIPTTRETVEKLEQCLQAAEFLFDALDIPEWVALSGIQNVQKYAAQLITLVRTHATVLDEHLNRHSEEWRVERLVKMDRDILRLAAAEMLYVDEVDAGVSINEAVELAKHYSTEESYRFINGVLGALADKLLAARATPNHA